ncbi:MAG: hypothetical protein P4M12_09730 [Gammaproteobacteria bacterium]|nr:hypothetical protein [Gammaproteobacteria bacterium]
MEEKLLETKAAFAARFGVTRQAMTKWSMRGWLVMVGRYVDVEANACNVKRYGDSYLRKTMQANGRNKKSG